MARWAFGPNTSLPWGGGSLGTMGANLLHGLTTGMDLTHAMNQYNRENNTLGWDIASQNSRNRASAFNGLNYANANMYANQQMRSQVPWLAGIPEQYGSEFYNHAGSTVGLNDNYGTNPYEQSPAAHSSSPTESSFSTAYEGSQPDQASNSASYPTVKINAPSYPLGAQSFMHMLQSVPTTPSYYTGDTNDGYYDWY